MEEWTDREASLKARESATAALRNLLVQVKNYECGLGYILATSSNIPPASTNESRQDWALIHCDSQRSFQNKVC
jgi:hypothetical protein